MKLASIIVPCRNERRHIEAFCAAALGQELPDGWRLQLVLADGQSDDGTRALLTKLAAADSRLAVIDNPDRIVSTGLNQALSIASGEVVVRMDVHSDYAPDYVAACIAVLAETGADNVGGPWHAEADEDLDVDDRRAAMQQAIAAAFQSRWVAGGAASRRLDFDGWVDTVYLGAWPRATFERFGGFDESLVRNQDDEHNLRIVKGGGRVWQSSRIHSVYRPRASLAQVFRQYLQYGYWKPFVMKKHGQPAAIRHLLPAVFVAALALSLVGIPFGLPATLFKSLLVLYALAVAAMTAGVQAERHLLNDALLRVPAVIAAYHVGYGIGSLCGFWDAFVRGRSRAGFTGLTR